MTAEFFERYRSKVVSVRELIDIVGPFPRRNSVILCHGVFDVVHPGHVRHLAYAKSKADVLVVSVTADRHITKGAYRPHIPQDLRALNLAAFEMVDYVLIDDEAMPLSNIRLIEPDFFAKGFEYTSSGIPAATEDEIAVVSSYGGQTIFTPGDVVYSSSAIISQRLPNVQIEKLLMLMSEYRLSFDDLEQALERFSQARVHVVGDTIVDSYTRTSVIGGQVKTPTLSVRMHERDDYVGGAAIVAQHMAAAGAHVDFTTVLGDDAYGELVRESLESAGIELHAVVDSTRPTTNKNVIIADGYRLLKIDTVDNRPVSEPVLERIVSHTHDIACDALVFSDFRHGLFNRHTTPRLIAAIPPGVFTVADSQVASRWGNITEFQGFDLITPNEREARFALGDQDSTVRGLAYVLLTSTRCKTLILKLGDRGLLCSSIAGDGTERFFSLDAFAKQVRDPVGAGDALLAYATLARLTTGSDALAAVIGSFAAAAECEIDGNVPVTPEAVRGFIQQIRARADYQVD